MSKPRAYSRETIEVMERFFQAVDMIVARKDIRGVKTYCTTYNIDHGKYYIQKNDLSKGFFQIGWAIPLVRDFGVSSDWLLLGKGNMLKR